MSFSNENVSFFAPFVALSANCIISNAYASMFSMALSFCHSFNPKTKWPFNCYALSFRFLLLVPKSQVQLTSNACSILIQYLLHYCQVCDERGTLTKVPCFSFLFFSFLFFLFVQRLIYFHVYSLHTASFDYFVARIVQWNASFNQI